MSFSAIKSEACSAVALELGYAWGTRQDKVAHLACDVAYRIPRPATAVYGTPIGWNLKRLEKIKRQARNDFRRQIASGVCVEIRQNPQAYGFGPIAIWFLMAFIGGIISAIAQKLFNRWWDGRWS